MHITVKIYSYLRSYLQNAKELTHGPEWEMPPDATVGQVLEKLRLPREVGVTVLVNSSSVDEKTRLKDKDVVHILPRMGGG
jgi:molybdopterin converting factor small subunit